MTGARGGINYSFPIKIECACQVAVGFGSIWLLADRPVNGNDVAVLSRVNDASGRVLNRIELPGSSVGGTVATGNGAVWVLEDGGKLFRIDPIANDITRTYETHAVETNTLVPLAGYDWICECVVNKILRFDPRNGHSKTYSIAARAFLVGINSRPHSGSSTRRTRPSPRSTRRPAGPSLLLGWTGTRSRPWSPSARCGPPPATLSTASI